MFSRKIEIAWSPINSSQNRNRGSNSRWQLQFLDEYLHIHMYVNVKLYRFRCCSADDPTSKWKTSCWKILISAAVARSQQRGGEKVKCRRGCWWRGKSEIENSKNLNTTTAYLILTGKKYFPNCELRKVLLIIPRNVCSFRSDIMTVTEW
jgi:hypothetical protein